MTTEPLRASPMRAPGRIALLLGVAGLALALALTAVGWVLVDAATDTLEDTLLLTDSALDSVEETISVVGDGIAGTAAGLSGLRSLADELDETLAATGTVLAEADTVLGETVPDGLDAVRQPLPAIESSFDLLRSTIESLSFLGIEPSGTLVSGESIRRIDRDLEVLASQLRDPDLRLGRVSMEFDDISAELGSLDLSLAAVLAEVDGAADVITSYETAAAEADRIVTDSLEDIDTRRALARAFVILFGLFGVAVASAVIAGGYGMLRQADARLASALSIDIADEDPGDPR